MNHEAVAYVVTDRGADWSPRYVVESADLKTRGYYRGFETRAEASAVRDQLNGKPGCRKCNDPAGPSGLCQMHHMMVQICPCCGMEVAKGELHSAGARP